MILTFKKVVIGCDKMVESCQEVAESINILQTTLQRSVGRNSKPLTILQHKVGLLSGPKK